MPAALQAALTVGAWILVVLLLTGGFWLLRRHHLLHTALFVILILVGIFLLVRLHELIIMIILAGVVAFILDGMVERLERFVPRALSIAVVYVGLVAVLTLTGTLVIPRVVREAERFIVALPTYTDKAKALSARLTSWYGGAPEQVQTAIDAAIEQLQNASRFATGEIEHTLKTILGWTVRSILILVMSIYLLTDKRNLQEQVVRVFAPEIRPEARETMAELSLTFSRYLRGQMTVILFVALAVTLALLAFHIPYAFFIGFMAGVLEVIPYFGAISGALPAVTLGFMKSPTAGISLIVIFIIINQIEGHVVIPLVMGGHLEMRPLTILLALIAGEMLFGIVGMIIAVPVISMIRVLIPHVMKHYQRLRAREYRLTVPPEGT